MIVDLQAEVKNLVAIHCQDGQSRIFLMLTFPPLTVSHHLLDHLPILHTLRMFTNVDNATMGKHSRSHHSTKLLDIATQVSGSRQLPVTSRYGQTDGRTHTFNLNI